MAAIKKADLVASFTEKQDREIEGLERLINEALKSEHAGDNTVRINLDERSYPHPKVLKEIRRRFEEAGWKFEIKSEQREGCWIELS